MKLLVGLGNPGSKYLKTRHNIGWLALDYLFPDAVYKEETTLQGAVAKIMAHGRKDEIQGNNERLPEPYQSVRRQRSEAVDTVDRFSPMSQDTILLKPLTFMNLSGESIQKTLHYYKIPLENLTVIYDDIDLPFGEIRIREKGSAGTHNGMKSILQHLKTEEFRRIRLGIESRPDELKAKIPLDTFVLSNFTASEQKELPRIFNQLLDKI